MFNSQDHKPDLKAKDCSQQTYREFFRIKDKFLIHCEIDDENKTGFIVFIDSDNDLDYLDKRDHKDWKENEKDQLSQSIAQLQIAEATPHLNLSEDQVLAFKRRLGGGYVMALHRNFGGVDGIIRDAVTFLLQRNREQARIMFLESAGVVALAVAVASMAMYCHGLSNKWLFGIAFGVLGAFTSIWTRYGRQSMTGLATRWLHYLESASRLFIGAVFGVVAMFAIKCGLLFSGIEQDIEVFAYSLTSFAAGFSERFVPSLIEKFINNEDAENEKTDHHNE